MFDVGTATTGLLVTISQIGYVFGLAFLVPLGDLVERRNLISISLAALAAGQAVSAIAPNLAVFAAAVLFDRHVIVVCGYDRVPIGMRSQGPA